MRIGNHVAAELKRRQWSQADLAASTDIPYAVIRRVARLHSDPALDYALRISRALQVPVEALFTLAAESGTTREPPDGASSRGRA